jgi:hypothetical protein
MVDGKIYIKRTFYLNVHIWWEYTHIMVVNFHLVNMDSQFASIVPNMQLSYLIKQP